MRWLQKRCPISDDGGSGAGGGPDSAANVAAAVASRRAAAGREAFRPGGMGGGWEARAKKGESGGERSEVEGVSRTTTGEGWNIFVLRFEVLGGVAGF